MAFHCRPRQLRRRIIALCAMLILAGAGAGAVARADTTGSAAQCPCHTEQRTTP